MSSKDYRDSHKEIIAKKYREWYKKNGRNRPDNYLEELKEYYIRHPERYVSRYKVRNAMKSGKLIRPKLCEVCGEERYLVAHHEDYSKPLQVVFVCSSCHRKIHNKTKST